MKKKILILSIAFVVLVIAFAPAKLAENFIPDNKGVAVSGLSGSVWSGEIASIVAPGISLSEIEFSTSLLDLMLANPSIMLDIAKGDLQGDLRVYLSEDLSQSVRLDNANLTLAAAHLEPFLPIRGVELSGQLSTGDLDVRAENKRPTFLEGNIQWRNASISFGGNSWPLGDYSVSVTTDEEKKIITAQLEKRKNELGLEGTITLLADGTVEIVGSIATEIDQTLYNAIALFNSGKPENGRLPIKFRQKIFK